MPAKRRTTGDLLLVVLLVTAVGFVLLSAVAPPHPTPSGSAGEQTFLIQPSIAAACNSTFSGASAGHNGQCGNWVLSGSSAVVAIAEAQGNAIASCLTVTDQAGASDHFYTVATFSSSGSVFGAVYEAENATATTNGSVTITVAAGGACGSSEYGGFMAVALTGTTGRLDNLSGVAALVAGQTQTLTTTFATDLIVGFGQSFSLHAYGSTVSGATNLTCEPTSTTPNGAHASCGVSTYYGVAWKDTRPGAAGSYTETYGPSAATLPQIIGLAFVGLPGAPPHKPTGLTVSLVTTTSFLESWTLPPGTITNVTGYLFGSPCPQAALGGVSLGAAATSHSWTGLTPGAKLCAGVAAWNATGESALNETNVTLPQTPAAPTGLAVIGNSSTTLLVNWTPPHGTVTGYAVQLKVNTAGTCTVLTVWANETGAVHQDNATGLAPSTKYCVGVAATNATGVGTFAWTNGTTTAGGGLLGGSVTLPLLLIVLVGAGLMVFAAGMAYAVSNRTASLLPMNPRTTPNAGPRRRGALGKAGVNPSLWGGGTVEASG